MFAAAALTALTRTLVVLSAPQVLASWDEATWKHGALARQLADGQPLGLDGLTRMALHPFNYHQPALVLWNLAYAGVAAVVGTGFVQLHLFMGLSAVIGAAAWASLLERHGSRLAAWAVAVGFAVMPLPALLLSVRPWSGHVEAQALAAAALAVGFGARSRGRVLLAGWLGGAALSLSALSLPLLMAGVLGLLLSRSLRPARAGVAALGVSVGLLPFALRELLSHGAMFRTPVLEDPLSRPVDILGGQFGVSVLDALWPPLHLVFHGVNVSAAHAWQGMPGGDDALANGAAVLAVGLCLLLALRLRGLDGALAWTLGLAPWLTLLMLGVAGPDLALRYLYGLYPVGLAALAWALGRASRFGAVAVFIAVLGGLSWLVPGTLDLARVVKPARFGLALGYAPDAWMIPMQLDASPPLEDWPAAERFLRDRAASTCCRSAMGFGAAFRPLDTRSAQGWQPRPEPGPEMVSAALGLVQVQRAEGVDRGLGRALVYRNLGWALVLRAGWDADRVQAWLDQAAPDLPRRRRAWLERGVEEGLARGRLRQTAR